ncbi:alpha/beta hydrolase [Sphingobium algorifonticola]|uniref:Alpha/beta hydrolase n=1 Tax=Sphingobium algorifonticola TaxID=2008318 RepID=A0A437JCB4_9SPHN|nr:alpha/beta hydrolase [Sphingobium algorifonticola]RVT43568.1 alpha/beta hydrolase [Sphingobium algorifonticola]
MTMDRRMLMTAGLGAALLEGTRGVAQTAAPGAGSFAAALPQPSETIDLWPNGAPGAPAVLPVEEVKERSTDTAVNDRALLNIARPRMAVFRPLRPNGAAILITPGGGYNWVVIDREGYELAALLADQGITAFVLFYRLPHQGWAAGPDVALSDAQRAIRLIRARAATYAIDPARVSSLGFSAGGHLCADLSVRFDARTYAAVDKADRLSARPFLSAPIYPVVSMRLPHAHAGSRRNMLGDAPTPEQEAAHSPDMNVPANAPPTFLIHAEDDGSVPVENSLLLRAALRAKGVPVETHLFTHGGHGFGIRRAIGKPVAAWPDLFLAWARTQGLFGS